MLIIAIEVCFKTENTLQNSFKGCKDKMAEKLFETPHVKKACEQFHYQRQFCFHLSHVCFEMIELITRHEQHEERDALERSETEKLQ